MNLAIKVSLVALLGLTDVIAEDSGTKAYFESQTDL